MQNLTLLVLVMVQGEHNYNDVQHLSISHSFYNYLHLLLICNLSLSAPPTTGGLAPAITLTDNALKHLNRMRADRDEDLCLRIGVKQGGCSGMSYTMEFEKRENARPDDSIIEYNGFIIGM